MLANAPMSLIDASVPVLEWCSYLRSAETAPGASIPPSQKVIFRVRQRRQLIVVPTRENTNLVLVDFVDQPMLIVDPAGPTTFQFMP
jgi:hypothetical protein